VAQCDIGTPDYADLCSDKYLSVLEVANPMHRLWSDGRLEQTHACPWLLLGKCTFCDVTLGYIKRYEPNKPQVICDRMEAIMAKTGYHGFHFTDEAAPPALLRGLAQEILRRKITVVWWTNIRFESSFNPRSVSVAERVRMHRCCRGTGGCLRPYPEADQQRGNGYSGGACCREISPGAGSWYMRT